MPEIGQTISHCRIVEKLGGGRMGVVFKTEDTRLKHTAALKFFPEALSKDGRALERFQHEAQPASALNHPQICTIYDIGEHEGKHFIAMEYLDGLTLKHRIQGKPLGMDEILDTAIQITDGLDAAHSQTTICRKGDNIMPVFVTLYKFTEQGTRDIKDSPERLKAAIKSFEAKGGKLLGAYYTIGEYDLITVGEIADEQAGLAHNLATVSLGNVRSTTLRGFTPTEFAEILNKM